MADLAVGELPRATSIDDESLLVMEQQGEARSVSGKVVKGLVEPYANAAQSAYEGVKEALDNIPAGATVIVNDLTTGGTTAALSAEQGKVLGAHISDKNNPHGVTAAQAGAFPSSGPVVTSYPNDIGVYTTTANIFSNMTPRWVFGTLQIVRGTAYATHIYASALDVYVGTTESAEIVEPTNWRSIATTDYAVNKAGDTMSGALAVNGGYGKVVASTESMGVSYRPTPGDASNYTFIGAFGKAELAQAAQLWRVTDGVQKTYSILHTGNKPSGSYTGNGDATERTIAIGGIGGAVALWSGEWGYGVIYPVGGIMANMNGAKYFGGAEVAYVNGMLTFKSTDNLLNASGITYYYQVL